MNQVLKMGTKLCHLPSVLTDPPGKTPVPSSLLKPLLLDEDTSPHTTQPCAQAASPCPLQHALDK